VETYPWPEELRCHVVEPGDDPRLHGYSIERDLARHYRFLDGVLLALSGELPSEAQSNAFDVALTFLAPLSMAEAPTHAAALAQICGSRSSSIIAVGAVALAERARHIVSEAAPLLSWLTAPGASLDPAFTARTDEDRQATQRLRDALAARGIHIASLEQPLSRSAALIAALWYSGLTRPEQIEAALVFASLPAVSAEAFSHGVASFRDYPMQLPPFEYKDP
jgi:hypothetical protein